MKTDDTLATLDRAGLLRVVKGLVAAGKIHPQVVAQQVRRAQRVEDLRAELARLEGNGALAADEAPVRQFGGTPPKRQMTPAMRQARVKQGAYLGRLRKLQFAGLNADRKQVRSIQKRDGTDAAIAMADKIIAKKIEARA